MTKEVWQALQKAVMLETNPLELSKEDWPWQYSHPWTDWRVGEQPGHQFDRRAATDYGRPEWFPEPSTAEQRDTCCHGEQPWNARGSSMNRMCRKLRASSWRRPRFAAFALRHARIVT